MYIIPSDRPLGRDNLAGGFDRLLGRDNVAVSSSFDWLLVRDTAVLAATPGVGSGEVSTSVSNDRTIN